MGESAVRKPRQERAARTRAALIEAATEQFEAQGYAKTTARSIASRAGVANGSFYQYFPDKDAILREIWIDRVARLQHDVRELATKYAHLDPEVEPKRLRRCMREVVRKISALHREGPGLHAVVMERAQADPSVKQVVRHAAETFVDVIADLLGMWSFEGDARARAFMIYALVDGAVDWHVIDEPLISDRRFERELSEVLVKLVS